MNQETKKVMSEGEKLEELVKSEAWNTAKLRLLKKLSLIDSITSIPDSDPQSFIVEVKSRAGAVSLLMDWINEIEGIAAQHKITKEQLADVRLDTEIEVRFQ